MHLFMIIQNILGFPGSLNDTCVPLLDGLLGDKDFLRMLLYESGGACRVLFFVLVCPSSFYFIC